ncbi:major facilitator superfamily domain-containing protein [Catenaria anguillulae PL171]|uniref:Major facilitator superfamily domain-containing protein n=1 Tax=Catenaria anguillulae PL171 TaxID=765915 RepID=A0A1Y2HA06_9FUNG|nr:major facilitator superfamily domain-containing protein [Catenaria anguillulae PL171]
MDTSLTDLLSSCLIHSRHRQLEREAYIYGNVPFKRWLLIPATIFIQLSAGSFYAWSVYNAPITKRLNEGNDQDIHAELISETFYAAVASFGLACFLCGPWLERHGPRRMTMIGATLFFIGQMITVLAMHVQSVPLLFIGYGAIGGFGIGCCYLIPVSVLQQWYPESKGFSAGVAVGSFGLGSVIASFTQSALIEAMGVMGTFLVLGCTYFVVQMLSALVMRFPPPDLMAANCRASNCPHAPKSSAGTGHHHPGQSAELEAMTASTLANDNDPSPDIPMIPLRHRCASLALSIHTIEDVDEFVRDIKSIDYRFLYLMFLLSVIPGLVLISRVADMVQLAFGKSVATATWVVGVNGGFNVLGRLLMGVLSDSLPRLPLLLSVFVLTIASLIALYFALAYALFPVFVVAMWSLTSLYGGGAALIPGLIGDVFGTRHIAGLYGVAMTAWAAGGVVGGVGFTAVIKSQREAGVPAQSVYDMSLYAMVVVATVGACVVVLYMARGKRRSEECVDRRGGLAH